MSTIETDNSRKLEEERRVHAQRDLDDGDTENIERNIDATRADMRATLEALERRFSFDRLVDLTVGRIRERGGEFASNLTEAATRNPMPLLLTSIGLGWMMLTSRGGTRGDGSTYYPTPGAREGIGERMRNAGDRAARAGDRVHGAAASAGGTLKDAAASSREALRSAAESSRETVEQTAESLRSGASRAAAATREQVEHARSRVDRLLDEQPLMLGALGLAAGAIIGALLPTTEHEDRFLGETRDKVVKDVAQKSRARFEAARENAAAYSAPHGSRAEETASREQPASRPH